MALDFTAYAVSGNEFLRMLEQNLGEARRHQASPILRSTFRVLRNHLLLEESFELLEHLPPAVQSVYIDGWQIRDYHRITSVDALMKEVSKDHPGFRLSPSNAQLLNAIRAVFKTISAYIAPEQLAAAITTLPTDVQNLFPRHGTEGNKAA